LEYLYPKQVDCIYIDPPYNTGARDWKYNNDYVDSSDAWRHIKWLSMMQKRLKIAKRILNPENSVLVVTIDEKEVHRLGLLLDEILPEARIQMVTIVTNPFGQERAKQLARVEEYAFFVFIGNAAPCSLTDDFLNVREATLFAENFGEAAQEVATPTEKIRWERLLRGGADALRRNNPGLFFPVFIDTDKRVIHSVGEPLATIDTDRNSVAAPPGTLAVWPIKTNGTEGRWRCSPSYLRELIAQGYARIGEYDKANDRWTLLYLNKSQIRRIDSGEVNVLGFGDDGSILLDKVAKKQQTFSVKTVWFRPLHRAGEWGTRYIRTLLPGREFPYPKSLYAVADTLRVVTGEKTNALVVDFFAGSGTTLHAVNLLNAYDGGNRRCILVTNNEVSDAESKRLAKDGYAPADGEWEQYGICRSITFPRTECSMLGKQSDGTVLAGDYIMPDGQKRPMSIGFPANVEYFKLGFLDRNSVSLGRQFAEILPLLWLKAGAVGERPTLEDDGIPEMMVLPQNKFAILAEETCYSEFMERLAETEGIETVYFVTNSEAAFRDMSAGVKSGRTFQLYRDYIDNFALGARRGNL
jgi:adenine-specific DNA-methyltransferase